MVYDCRICTRTQTQLNKTLHRSRSIFDSSKFKSQTLRVFVRMAGDEGDRPDFVEDRREPLIDLESSDSTELWLIQWPHMQDLDFHGQEVSLKLNRDGSLGNFSGTSGKEYEVVSFKSFDADAAVFVSDPSGSKAVGKISRRVSFVHYPEPSELSVYDPDKAKEERSKAFFERSLRTASSRNGPSMSRSTRMTTTNRWSNRTNSSRSGSNQRSAVSQANTPPNSSGKRKSSGSSDTKSSKVKQEQ